MSIPIRGASHGSPGAAYETAKRRGAQRLDFLLAYLTALYADAATVGLRADVLVAQSDLETGAFTSTYWTRDGNPAGLAAFDDGSSWGLTFTPAKAARAQVTHMLAYLGIEPPPGWKATDARWQAVTDAGYFGSVRTTADLGNGRWATDPLYGSKIEQRHAAYSFTPLKEGTAMAGYKAHHFPGFPRNPVYLPDWIPVEIKIIPSSVPGWTSGTKFTGQTQITWHDTGNPSSSASSEWSWAANGGRANINSPGSYNGIYDRYRIVISQRFDEIVGHAGTPAGNRSWAFEQAFGPGYAESLPVGAALFGGIIAAMGWSVDTALRKHQDWSGKWCPAQTLNRGMWPQVQAMVADAARKAAAAAAGTDPAPDIAVGATVATTVNLYVRDKATTAGGVVTLAAAGTEYEVIGGPQSADGHQWWHLSDGTVSGWASDGIAGTPYLVVTKPAPVVEPEPTPAYPKPVAIAELAPYVGRPIVPMPSVIPLADGGTAFPAFDRVRAKVATPRLRFAGSDERLGPDIEQGAEFDVSFLLVGEGYEPTYLTPWLTRVKAADCEVISDAPKDMQPAAPAAA